MVLEELLISDDHLYITSAQDYSYLDSLSLKLLSSLLLLVRSSVSFPSSVLLSDNCFSSGSSSELVLVIHEL